MQKVFFFNKRNPSTGEIVEDKVLDADEKTAWSYYNKPRFFNYIGWSDGRFMRELKKDISLLPKDERGITQQPDKDTQNRVKEMIEKEVEFARTNPDKSPPRNLTRRGLNSRDQQDQLLMNRIKGMRN